MSEDGPIEWERQAEEDQYRKSRTRLNVVFWIAFLLLLIVVITLGAMVLRS